MDQVKAALGWLKEHHFWILALVVVGLSVGGWFTATGELSQKYSSAKSKIESTYSSQRSLAGKPFKPNPSVNEKQQEQNVALASSVKQIWDELYNAQKEQVLKWPPQLGRSFLNRIAKKSFGDTIVRDDRDRYLNYIKRRFPQLLEIVDAAPDGGPNGGVSMGRGGGMPTEGFGPSSAAPVGAGAGQMDAEPEHLVAWLDQDTLKARMTFRETPSDLQIWVTQEDLWVYETLLSAIAKTNEAAGATRRSNAAIRIIEQLQVGARAATQTQTTGRIYVPESGGGGALAGGMGGGGGFGGGRGGGFGEGGMRGMGGSADDGSLLEGRYVDEAGQPVAVPPGTFTVGVEYKQLPVLMQLEMDSRWLTELIVNLSNAPLQVKIDQVRVNPEGSDVRIGGGASGGNDVRSFDRTPTIQPVMLQGSVYMFNEPDEETFQVGGDEI